MVVFAFDCPDGTALQGHGVAFAVGQCTYIVFVIGTQGPLTWVDAGAIVQSVAPPDPNAAATGGDQQAARSFLGVAPTAEGATAEGLPEGWLWKQALNGAAVQVFQ